VRANSAVASARREAPCLDWFASGLLFGVELGHLPLPGRHVPGLGEPATGLLALSANPRQRDLIARGRAIEVPTNDLRDCVVIDAAHLFEEPADRVLVPLLGKDWPWTRLSWPVEYRRRTVGVAASSAVGTSRCRVRASLLGIQACERRVESQSIAISHEMGKDLRDGIFVHVRLVAMRVRGTATRVGGGEGSGAA
jgi:hypothetical protein